MRTVVTIVCCLTGVVVAGVGASGVISSGSASGTLAGRILYTGAVPAPTGVAESGSVQPVLYVDASGALQYAVVSVNGAEPSGGTAPSGATIKQVGYIFEPQVTAVRDGAVVTFTNNDVANHNVRANAPPNVFSLKTSRAAVSATFQATPDGAPVAITCDIHAWMTAWVLVFRHPFFTVTGADGRFRIDNVPEGSHEVVVQQPAGGLRRTTRVSITAGAVTTLPDIVFRSADLHLP